jgi:hypothetical protein
MRRSDVRSSIPVEATARGDRTDRVVAALPSRHLPPVEVRELPEAPTSVKFFE